MCAPPPLHERVHARARARSDGCVGAGQYGVGAMDEAVVGASESLIRHVAIAIAVCLCLPHPFPEIASPAARLAAPPPPMLSSALLPTLYRCKASPAGADCCRRGSPAAGRGFSLLGRTGPQAAGCPFGSPRPQAYAALP